MKTRLGNSVYTKVLIAFLVASLVIGLGLSTMRFLSSTLPNVEISIAAVREYARMMAREIGTPPDLEVAERLYRQTGVDMAILGPGVEWASSQECLDQAKERGEAGDFFRRSEINDGDYLITLNQPPWKFMFTEFHADHELGVLVLSVGLFSILAALLSGFLIIRHILKPLRKMKTVAREFGVADWKSRVNPEGKDEFAELGAAMDSMADRIEGYIRSMHDLVAAVSHELRSPLTRMKLALEFTSDTALKDSMNQEIDALNRLTGSLLEEYRLRTQPDVLRREEVNLEEWLAEVTAPYLAQAMDLNVQVQLKEGTLSGQPEPFRMAGNSGRQDYPEHPDSRHHPTALLDRARMDLLVRNLLENALRHAPGSRVCITLTDQVPAPGRFTLTVEDSGPGMDEGLMARIGEPFLSADPSRTGKRESGGFGLGLAIICAIAQAHGGTAGFYRPPAGGFGARIILPVE